MKMYVKKNPLSCVKKTLEQCVTDCLLYGLDEHLVLMYEFFEQCPSLYHISEEELYMCIAFGSSSAEDRSKSLALIFQLAHITNLPSWTIHNFFSTSTTRYKLHKIHPNNLLMLIEHNGTDAKHSSLALIEFVMAVCRHHLVLHMDCLEQEIEDMEFTSLFKNAVCIITLLITKGNGSVQKKHDALYQSIANIDNIGDDLICHPIPQKWMSQRSELIACLIEHGANVYSLSKPFRTALLENDDVQKCLVESSMKHVNDCCVCLESLMMVAAHTNNTTCCCSSYEITFENAFVLIVLRSIILRQLQVVHMMWEKQIEKSKQQTKRLLSLLSDLHQHDEPG
jgi:hypothetical protein